MLEFDINIRYNIQEINKNLYDFKNEKDFNLEFDFSKGIKLGKGTFGIVNKC